MIIKYTSFIFLFFIMNTKKKLYFTWMHCKACEILARHTCENIDWIQCEKVSHKNWLLEISIDNNKSEKRLIKEMKKHWYAYSDNPVKLAWWLKTLSQSDVMQIVWIIIVVWALRFVSGQIWWTDSLMAIVWGAWYGTALLTGLVASISTCLAVTWWIVIWFSNYIDDEQTKQRHIWVQLLFQIWRVLWFFIFGSLLGLLWDAISISLDVTIVLSLVVAILMLYLWCQILHLLPPLSHWWIGISLSRSDKLHTHNHPWIAPLIGALTFFIPCGFTQGMQLIALWSGNWLAWWITMGLFALGTAPVLFALWLWSSWVKDQSRWLAKQVIWVIIIAFWLSTIMTTRNLIGRWASTWNVVETEIYDWNKSIIEISAVHDGRQIENRDISLPANTPYKLTINPQDNGIWCMSSMVIPKAGFRDPERIVKNTPIIFEWNWLQRWRYPIVCASMGMEMGALVVE